MNLEEIGSYLSEHSHLKVVDLTLRCLGFTALTLNSLLDEVYDTAEAVARWGIEEEEDVI